jgi:crotonobetainyl-CoA:carnitine CoA-transferase CaiB-like acyl-CoA transferase
VNAEELLTLILTTTGEAPAGSAVELRGSDPVFPTPFLIGELGAATISASALAAARLFEDRTGRKQRVRIAIDAAAAATRSSRYLQSEIPPAPRSGAAENGMYELRDGRFFYFQSVFKHHWERQLAVLGCGPDEEEIVRRVKGWDGLELEEAVVAAGAAGALVRTNEEWAAHPQSAALASLPIVEIRKIGESEPEPLGDATRPLSSVRALDLTRVLAGPTCGRTLAEHGAEVLRIGTSAFPDDEQMMRDTGHGKRSVELDLKSAEGSMRLRHLIPDADIFSEGYRPGALSALGFSPEEVAVLRPGIVYVSLCAFGHVGPWQQRRGFDSIVQSVMGIANEASGSEGAPHMASPSILDYTTGYLAAFGAMTALRRRAKAGGSYHVRVSLAKLGELLKAAGRADDAAVKARPAQLPEARVAELLTTRDTPYGHLQYLRPCAELSETPGRWDLPTTPLDNDVPEWTTSGRR